MLGSSTVGLRMGEGTEEARGLKSAGGRLLEDRGKSGGGFQDCTVPAWESSIFQVGSTLCSVVPGTWNKAGPSPGSARAVPPAAE